jgi:hypothetical protein
MEEQKDKKLKTYQKISNLLCCIFIIFIIPHIVFIVSGKVIFYGFLAFCLFLISLLCIPLLIIYILIWSIYLYFKSNKIIHLNSIVLLLFAIFFTLHVTGFCFKEMRYLSKAEIIDKAVSAHLSRSCRQEYEIKYGKLPQLEKPTRDGYMDWDKIESGCSVTTFEDLKQEAPQCFQEERLNKCRGTVTHFDKKANTIVKSEIEIYSYSTFYANNIMNRAYKRFDIESDLDLYRDGNRYVVSACGVVDCYGCFD